MLSLNLRQPQASLPTLILHTSTAMLLPSLSLVLSTSTLALAATQKVSRAAANNPNDSAGASFVCRPLLPHVERAASCAGRRGGGMTAAFRVARNRQADPRVLCSLSYRQSALVSLTKSTWSCALCRCCHLGRKRPRNVGQKRGRTRSEGLFSCVSRRRELGRYPTTCALMAGLCDWAADSGLRW